MHVYSTHLQRQERELIRYSPKWQQVSLVASAVMLQVLQAMHPRFRIPVYPQQRLLLRKRKVVAVTSVWNKHVIVQEEQKCLYTLGEE